MNKEFGKIFKKYTYQSEPDLSISIWNKIIKREKKIAKIKLLVFSFLGLTSFLSSIPVIKILLNDLSKSGFYDYLSVLFSGNGIFISYWKEISLSITESLPSASIFYAFTLIFIFILSLRFVVKQIISGQLLTLQARPV